MKFVLSFISILFASCGTDVGDLGPDLGPDLEACTSSSEGILCSNGVAQILRDGNCDHVTVCPAPLSCVSNLCQDVPLEVVDPWTKPTGSPQTLTWFVTDPIRPGHTSTSDTSSGEFVYNIMAKGYDSLDDWCESQAHQSQVESLHGKKWTALIVAMPDQYSFLPLTKQSNYIGQSRINFYHNLSIKNYYVSRPAPPVSVPLPFSWSYPLIFDKHGVIHNKTGLDNAWSGIDRSFCQGIANSFPQDSCDSYGTGWDSDGGYIGCGLRTWHDSAYPSACWAFESACPIDSWNKCPGSMPFATQGSCTNPGPYGRDCTGINNPDRPLSIRAGIAATGYTSTNLWGSTARNDGGVVFMHQNTGAVIIFLRPLLASGQGSRAGHTGIGTQDHFCGEKSPMVGFDFISACLEVYSLTTFLGAGPRNAKPIVCVESIATPKSTQ